MTKQIGLWLASCYIFRHLVYITSFGLVLWVPGLVALLIYGASSQNNFNRPAILSVGLFWWSIWLSSAWVGIWVCSIIANVTPKVIRRILGEQNRADTRWTVAHLSATFLQVSWLLLSKITLIMQRLLKSTLPFFSGQCLFGSSIYPPYGLNSLGVIP